LAVIMPIDVGLCKIATATRVFRGQILIFDATLCCVFRHLDEEKRHGRSQK
jgi:hypothetical protein